MNECNCQVAAMIGCPYDGHKIDCPAVKYVEEYINESVRSSKDAEEEKESDKNG